MENRDEVKFLIADVGQSPEVILNKRIIEKGMTLVRLRLGQLFKNVGRQ